MLNKILYKIKVPFEDLLFLLKIKIMNQKNLSLSGKCNQCGSCCKRLMLTDGFKPIRSLEQWEKIKKDHPQYQIFEFLEKENGALLFQCTKLDENNQCSIYDNRPLVCRRYPQKNQLIRYPSEFIDCGFYLSNKIKFKDILDKKKSSD